MCSDPINNPVLAVIISKDRLSRVALELEEPYVRIYENKRRILKKLNKNHG